MDNIIIKLQMKRKLVNIDYNNNILIKEFKCLIILSID